MRYVLSSALARETDLYTQTEIGIPSLVLMERAAYECVQVIEARYPRASRILCVCGSGNNGGDGVCIARILAQRGCKTGVILLGNPEKRTESLRSQIRWAEKCGVSFEAFPKDPCAMSHERNAPDLSGWDLIVDAIFGIGLTREVRGSFAGMIDQINASGLPVLGVDIPSGIHTDTGQVLGCAVHCDVTVTFQVLKPGLLLAPGKYYAGEVLTREIGIYLSDHLARFDSFVPEHTDFSLLGRRPDGNKGTFGKILVLAGCQSIFGAAVLAARAVLRAGSGMVKVFTEETNRIPLLTAFPETLADFWKSGEKIPEEKLLAACDWSDACLIGPGLGTSAEAERLMELVLANYRGNLVIDADGCNLLAEHPEWISMLEKRERAWGAFTLLTPHAGELSRLLALPISELKTDPACFARMACERYHAAVIFKDAVSVLCGRTPQGTYQYWYQTAGCSALAKAGSGDVLAGICASFLGRKDLLGEYELKADILSDGRKAPLFLSALAMYAHGCCGELAAKELGEQAVLAGDLADYLGKVLSGDSDAVS